MGKALTGRVGLSDGPAVRVSDDLGQTAFGPSLQLVMKADARV